MKKTLLTILAAICISFGAEAVEFHGGYDYQSSYTDEGKKVTYRQIVTSSGYFVGDSLIMRLKFEYDNSGRPRQSTTFSTRNFDIAIKSGKHYLAVHRDRFEFECYQGDQYDHLHVTCASLIRIPMSRGKFEMSLSNNTLKNPKENYTKKVPEIAIECYETLYGGSCD